MATDKNNPIPEKELIVKGAGPLIRSNEVLMSAAFANKDREILLAQMVYWNDLSKVISDYRQAACKLWDMHVGSGYVDASWANGIERIVKKDPDKPRGRKASVKVDPAENC
jgi:hypothetical protein